MKRVLRLLLILLGCLGLPAAVLWFVPLDRYVPRIEAAATDALGQPVRIGRLRLALLPTPHATLQDLSAGSRGEVRIAALRIYPALTTLASRTRVLRSVEIEGLAAPAGALAALQTPPRGDGPASLRLEKLVLKDIRLALPEAALPPLEGEIRFDDRQSVAAALLATEDGALRLQADAAAGGLDLALQARDWALPAGPPLQFESLQGRGRLEGSRLTVERLEGRFYGGRLEAAARGSWAAGLRLEGQIKLQDVAVAPLLAAVGSPPRLAGRLDSQSRFALGARSAARLGESARVDGNFLVRQGVLHDMDLAKAATLLVRSGAKGGETRFDEFQGRYRLAGRDLYLEDLKVRSGVLDAAGNVHVAPQDALSGKVTVKLTTGVSLVTVPLRVAGTTRDPILYPTGAALAGAAVGTATLGPGVGTTLGTRVADFFDDLLSKKPPKAGPPPTPGE